MNLAIMAGGPSSERVISLQTAENVAEKLALSGYNCYIIDVNGDNWSYKYYGNNFQINKTNFSLVVENNLVKFDLAVIEIHGKQGEDGLLQGYFEMMNIPYTTCNVLSSALTFDKIKCKQFLSASSIPMAKQFIVQNGDKINENEIISHLSLPVFVKPNTAGSSFGVTKVYDKSDLLEAISNAYEEDNQVIIEEFIDGVEVSCGVFKTVESTIIFPITEIVTSNDFFDYEAKYNSELTEEITPARISKIETNAVKKFASQIYDLTGCHGIVRIDFIIKDSIPYFLEVNTIPGMSANSIIPKQIRCLGLSEKNILDTLVRDSLSRHSKK